MKRNPPKSLSVVLSVRNESPWISDQLASITSQQVGTPFEVLVADGGSTDDTVERAEAFAEQGHRVTVLDASERRGKQFGQRLGALAASGELLAFADGDDVACPGWLQAIVDASPDYDMVGGPLDLGTLNDPQLVASRPWVKRVTKGLPEALRSGHVYAVGANSAIWRSVFLEVDQPGYDLPAEASAAEDMDLMFRLRRAGGTVGFAPGAVMAYRLRSDGSALRRQVRAYGVGDAAVVKRYHDLGARGDPLPEALRKWARLLPAAVKAALEHDDLHWARTELVGARGRLAGSLMFLTFCL